MQESNGFQVSFSRTIEVFNKYEIPLIRYRWVKTPTEAGLAARYLNFPVVVKLITPLFPHKSEAGLVALDINSPEEVEKISSQMIERILGVGYEGILIQEKAKPGIEVIVGINYDTQFGPVILFGAGGLFAEFLEDYVIGIPPLTQRQVHELIMQTKIGKLLMGVRNKPPADIAGLEDLILKVSSIAVENKDWIMSLDLNPVVVYEQGQGVEILDFRMFSREPAIEG